MFYGFNQILNFDFMQTFLDCGYVFFFFSFFYLIIYSGLDFIDIKTWLYRTAHIAVCILPWVDVNTFPLCESWHPILIMDRGFWFNFRARGETVISSAHYTVNESVVKSDPFQLSAAHLCGFMSGSTRSTYFNLQKSSSLPPFIRPPNGKRLIFSLALFLRRPWIALCRGGLFRR